MFLGWHRTVPGVCLTNLVKEGHKLQFLLFLPTNSMILMQRLPLFLFVILFFQLKIAAAQGFDDSLQLKLPGNQWYASWSSDGRQLVYQSDANGNWDIYLYSLETGKVSALTHSPFDEQHPVWVPGKRAVVFERGKGRHSHLVVFRLSDGVEKRLINRPIACKEASFTPSRHLVAFSGWDDISESWQLFTYDFVYDNLNQLTHEEGNVGFPVFDSKGKTIAFLIRRDGHKPVLAMCNWYGEELYRMANLSPGKVSWTPSGWRFYGIDHPGVGRWSVCSWRKKGTAKIILYNGRKGLCCPALSPDGRWWVISKERDNGEFDLWIYPSENPSQQE